jgi:hypothetical protein
VRAKKMLVKLTTHNI